VRLAFTFILLVAASIARLSAAEFYNITDPFMAEYEGFWTAKSGAKGRVTAQIRPLSNNQYDGFVLLSRTKAPVTAFKLKTATAENGLLKFTGASASEAGGDLLAASQTTCEIRDGKLTGTFSGELGEGTFDARRHERKSPTMGAKPPKHAIVLTQNDTNLWEKLSWPLSPEGVLRVARGNISAKDKLSNFRLHLEFRTPYMPAEEGQARGNSGVYLLGRYEIQVLDSYQNKTYFNGQAGSFYGHNAPLVNASRKPGEWQAYDIIFRAPKKAADGSITPGSFTVLHNGILVQDHIPVKGEATTAAAFQNFSEKGPIVLQDHNNPVRYRNIWLRKL
jgi:hypothetical protein